MDRYVNHQGKRNKTFDGGGDTMNFIKHMAHKSYPKGPSLSRVIIRTHTLFNELDSM